MKTTKIKIALSVLLMSALVGVGAGVFSRRSDAADTQRPRRAEARGPAKARPDDTPAKSRFRFLSLAEARAIALECGEAKEPTLVFPGVGPDLKSQGPSKFRPPLVLTDLTPGAEGILVTNFPGNLGRAELERAINQVLLNVEVAYWNLYGSYWQLYSREQGLRFAYETWKVTGAQFKVGRVGLAEFAQSQGQYEQFRSQRLQAIDTLLDNERQLRALLGMPAETGVRLVPADAPTLVERHPSWQKGWAEAMKRRPELRLARQDVKIAQLNVQLAKNYLLPDLRTHAAYDTNSIDNTPDTPNDRTTGLRSATPTGFRFAHAQLRQAQLQSGRANLVLQDQELKAERFLGMYYRWMSSAYAQIKAARAQRESFATQSRVRYDLYRMGANEPGRVTLNLLLEAQRFWADALATEYQAIVTYNNAIAGWEYAKGTILTHARVSLAEELPDGDAVRAVVYERKQTGQRVRREPKVPADSPLGGLGAKKGEGDRQPETAPSLPALWKRFPPLRGADAPPPVERTSAREARWTEWGASDIFPHNRRTP
jgi:hypothetical protein